MLKLQHKEAISSPIDLCDNVVIIYATETGTSEMYARILWKAFRIHKIIRTKVISFNDVDFANVAKSKIAIIIVSTTGQGDVPREMKEKWNVLLNKSHNSTFLKGLKFCVLGLGDSKYQKFNFCAKMLHRRLLQLGGISALNPSYADDQDYHGSDEVAIPWLYSVYKLTTCMFTDIDTKQLLSSEIDLMNIEYTPRFHVEEAVNYKINKSDEKENVYILNSKNYHHCTVVENKIITDLQHFQQINKITFKLSCSPFLAKPGDFIVIHPENSNESILNILKVLENSKCYIFNADYSLRITKTDICDIIPPFFDGIHKIGNLFKYYFDFNAVPRRITFKYLYFISKNDKEKQRLYEIFSNYDDYLDYCYRPKKTFVDILIDFAETTKSIKLEHIFDLIPQIKSRSYSLCDFDHHDDFSFATIVVAKVQYKTNMTKPRIGLCSTFLCSIPDGYNLLTIVNRGSLKFPNDKTPLIMVGPGTGCAPFSFYYNLLLKNKNFPKFYNPESRLYLGFRNLKMDFLLNEIWKKAIENFNSNIRIAFSRDSPSNKVYVTHLITKDSEEIIELILNRAIIMICGNGTQMPNDVRNVVKNILKEKSCLTEEQAVEYMRNMERNGLIQEDTWK